MKLQNSQHREIVGGRIEDANNTRNVILQQDIENKPSLLFCIRLAADHPTEVVRQQL